MYSWWWVWKAPETCRVTLQWNETDCAQLHPVGLLWYRVAMHGTEHLKFKETVELKFPLWTFIAWCFYFRINNWGWSSDINIWHCFNQIWYIQFQICATVPSLANKISCLCFHLAVAFNLYHLDYILSPCHTGMRLRVLSILYSPEDNVRVIRANGYTPSSSRHSLLGFLYSRWEWEGVRGRRFYLSNDPWITNINTYGGETNNTREEGTRLDGFCRVVVVLEECEVVHWCLLTYLLHGAESFLRS